MDKNKRYTGIDKDPSGAMNPTGNIIRDAWLFNLIPESETCEGWTLQGIDALYDKVSKEWEKYAYRIAELPDELRARHQRIYSEATARARALGWDPELGDEG